MQKEKYIIWDFDGTLAKRNGGWADTLMEIVHNEHGDLQVSKEMILPYLQYGFPWHTPDLINEPLKDSPTWWGKLELIFTKALNEGGGVGINTAKVMAKKVRSYYLRPESW